MLEIKKLSISTRERLLTNFSYTFSNGLYGLVATNGSGKTTFFRIISGLLKPEEGYISCNGKRLFYFENSEWFNQNLSGLDYIKFFKKEYKSNVSENEIIKLWEMENYIKLPIKKYSLGMKQKLLIALYQITDADILLMDEITNGLDEKSREKLFLVIHIFKKKGKLVIMSSHYKEDIITYCDYLMVLKEQKMEINKL